MAKRKTASGGDALSTPRPVKKAKPETTSSPVQHAVLRQYYADVRTLRGYVLAKLPSSSRIRRKKIESVGLSGKATCNQTELVLGLLLDTTLVACCDPVKLATGKAPNLRWQQWLAFSHKGGDQSSVTPSDGLKGSDHLQDQILDFMVWHLLPDAEPGRSWADKHLLCDGFRKYPSEHAKMVIPGNLYEHFPNRRVETLRRHPWPQLLMLLGKDAERIMIDLLGDCAIFLPVKAGKDNLYQLSGTPISALRPLASEDAHSPGSETVSASKGAVERRPVEISFARNRMLYARAALNAKGNIRFGLRHIHVLNRFPFRPHGSPSEEAQCLEPATNAPNEDDSVVHIMMYIFPRQFGLHNVFTSEVDRRKTAQTFQDYTLREEEIAKKFPVTVEKSRHAAKHIPKRLRGSLPHLIQRLQVLHGRCAYAPMLQHYCPVLEKVTLEKQKRPNSSKNSQRTLEQPQPTPASSVPQYDSLVELATPSSAVSAFCQAVLSKVVPNELWGNGPAQEHNKKCFLKHVHQFIHLRRFEIMCLHGVMQGMKIQDIEWLAPPGLAGQKCSQSDMRKRLEIFYELLYYLFDSLLIPLIRSNFYVTESSVHRFRLFFFRHDVWRHIAEPAMASLKAKMFEEVAFTEAELKALKRREIGFGQLRLLPKQGTMRPIMNLKRRPMHPEKKTLGKSINSIVEPVSIMLKLEKSLNPSFLGSSMFCVNDIYPRIKVFKARLGSSPPPLYFAKVDVKAAFDTIPQDAVLDMVGRIPTQSGYFTSKHVEVSPLETDNCKTMKRWHNTGRIPSDKTGFLARLVAAPTTVTRSNAVFSDSAAEWLHRTPKLLALTHEHIKRNLVRIGKKYYRQKTGIPQGSVLSSTLCNYFYAELERTHLAFLSDEGSLLMRLIDDFLLITTDRRKAARFIQVMHRGVPKYGVTVSQGKSLVNFPITIDGTPVPVIDSKTSGFPYCGLAIDCATLDIRKQRDGVGKDPVIFNALTVDYSRHPGSNFKRKVLKAFKIQSHWMYFDTTHNSRQAVLVNAYTAFVETATKMWAHVRCLPKQKRPGLPLFADTITTLADVAHLLLTSKSRKQRYPGYTCSIKKGELSWLAMFACRKVLLKRQSGYKEVIAWLESKIQHLSSEKGLDCKGLVRTVERYQ